MTPEEKNHRRNKRQDDRKWFVLHLGKEYMKGKEVHHEWDRGERTFILSIEWHTFITQQEKRDTMTTIKRVERRIKFEAKLRRKQKK